MNGNLKENHFLNTQAIIRLGICFCALSIYAALIWSAPPHLVYDESYHLSTVELLKQKGFTREFIRDLPGPAGPLYSIVHTVAAPLTGLKPPGIRLLTLGFLILSGFALSALFKELQVPPLGAFELFCLPTAGVAAGMALTELHALVFAILAILFLMKGVRTQSRSISLFLSLLGGIFLGVAILGRQPFLMFLICLPVLLFETPRPWKSIVMFILGTVIIVSPVFWIWGGVIPPLSIGKASGIALKHGVLACAFAGLTVALIAPAYLKLPWKLLLAATLIPAILNYLFHWITLMPMQTVAMTLLGARAYESLMGVTSAAIVAAGSLFIVTTLLNLWEHRKNSKIIFCAFCGLLILASCAKVTHVFSSRYVTQAMPFLLLLLSFYQRGRWVRTWGLAVSTLLSVLCLWSYLYKM